MLRMMAPEQPPSDPLKSHVSIKNEQFFIKLNECVSRYGFGGADTPRNVVHEHKS